MTYKRHAKDTKIRYILQEETEEPTTEPINVSTIKSVVKLIPIHTYKTEETTTEPINVSTIKVPDKYNKIQLGFTIKFKSPYSFIKAIKDDSIKNILNNNIPISKEKKQIRVKAVYNLSYKVFDTLNKDDKIKLIGYLQESINT